MRNDRPFTVLCNHCRGQVGPPVVLIGEDEVARLREHLRMCARDVGERAASVGELLNHFWLTRTLYAEHA